MKQRLFFATLTLVVLLGVLIGMRTVQESGTQETAGVHQETETTSPLALELYQHRNPFIGDASRNGQILRVLEVGEELGTYHMELETNERPYILRVIFNQEPEDADETDSQMNRYGLILLALIDNADEIQWAYPQMEQGDPVTASQKAVREDLYQVLEIQPEEFELTPDLVDQLLKIR
jgi:hypothetical protein